VCLLLTRAKVEGSTIREAVPVESVVHETQEAAGAATEPVEIASEGAPGVAEEERDEVLPEFKPGSSRPFARDSGCGADPFGADVRGRHD
jgi:hypothetical protein